VKSYAVLSAAITAAAQKSKQITAFIMFLSLCLFLLCSMPSGNGIGPVASALEHIVRASRLFHGNENGNKMRCPFEWH
jgi:hypothetical protein